LRGCNGATRRPLRSRNIFRIGLGLPQLHNLKQNNRLTILLGSVHVAAPALPLRAVQRRRDAVRIAIPRRGDEIAPCFEHCTTMAVFEISETGRMEQVDYPLRSRDPFDRVRLLRDRGVDTLICGAVQDVYEDLLRASGFVVISWVSGFVEDLLALHLRGALASGAELPVTGDGLHEVMDRMMEG
jgi:predicted Fe-Mo cluster-binding NifX family protein